MANLGEMMTETTRAMGGTPLALTTDTVENAATDGASLFYNPSFFSQLESAAGDDGVRFVIAHELGHQVNGLSMGGHAGEYAADAFAARALARAGGNFAAISSVFTFLGGEACDSHPSSSSRMSRAHAAFVNARAELWESDHQERPARQVGYDRDLAI